MLSFHLVNRFSAARPIKLAFDTVRVYLNYADYVFWEQTNFCMPFVRLLSLSRLPTSQHAARNAVLASWKTLMLQSCIHVLFAWARTLHSTPRPSRLIRGHIPCILGNLRATITTLSTTTGSELPCTAQARPVNFVVVVSSRTPNKVDSRRTAIHKLRQV